MSGRNSLLLLLLLLILGALWFIRRSSEYTDVQGIPPELAALKSFDPDKVVEVKITRGEEHIDIQVATITSGQLTHIPFKD